MRRKKRNTGLVSDHFQVFLFLSIKTMDTGTMNTVSAHIVVLEFMAILPRIVAVLD